MVRKKRTERYASDYEKHSSEAKSRVLRISEAGRAIGDIPACKDLGLLREVSESFLSFCTKCFPARFNIAWSKDHLYVIDKMQTAINDRRLFALAMPRGSGKTSLSECSVIWSILTGKDPFVFLIGSSKETSEKLLESIKSELTHNDHLMALFPEAIFPIRSLGGESRRCGGQTHLGEHTNIWWGSNEIRMPCIEGSLSSGAVIRVSGITGTIRGAKHVKPDGLNIRPSLVVIDDPQTDKSAISLTMTNARENVVSGAILGLAGPKKKISGFMPITVIAQGDLADRVLDPDRNPDWQGSRMKMVYSFPANRNLWDKYAVIRKESLISRGDISDATEFYRKNREEMDEGSEVAWEERYDSLELSALQNAMNLMYRDEAAFFSEYQNEPTSAASGDFTELKAVDICLKTNNIPKFVVPSDCTKATSFIDVHDNLLYYTTIAWGDGFTGYVIDYGCFPEQPVEYFTLRNAKRTLRALHTDKGIEGAIYAGLSEICDKILGGQLKGDDGEILQVSKCLIDANYGPMTDVVYQFSRQTKYKNIVTPSHGKYFGASSLPISDYKKRPGDLIGHNWRSPNTKETKRSVRHVLFDTNYWKSFSHERLRVAIGDIGCLSLFGDNPREHELYSEHLTAEYRIRTEGRGRVVDEWKVSPGRADNHWFDCLVGNCVAASMIGVTIPSHGNIAVRPKKMVRLSEIQREKRNFGGR